MDHLIPILPPHTLHNAGDFHAGNSHAGSSREVLDINLADPMTLKARASHPRSCDIGNRKICTHECTNDPSYPVELPPVSPAPPPVITEDEINDDADCFLLNAEQFDTASFLTNNAVQELKSLYPELFAALDDHPTDTDGGGWDDIMTQPYNQEHYQQYQAIAKYIYQYQEADNLDEIMESPEETWTACKTTYGIYRTGCFYYDDEGIEGSRLILEHERYKLIKENSNLKTKLEAFKNQLKVCNNERDYYHQKLHEVSEFASNITALVHNKDLSSCEIVYCLCAVFFDATHMTLNDLLRPPTLDYRRWLSRSTRFI